jgi:hypothetical protein
VARIVESGQLLPHPLFGFEVEVLSSDLAAAKEILQELMAPPE